MRNRCGNLDPHHPHWMRAREGEKSGGGSGWLECHGIADPNCPTCKGEGITGGKTQQANDLPWACHTCLPNPGLRPDLKEKRAAAPERPPAEFKTDPHPYEVPEGQAGEGLSLSLNDEGTLAAITAYDRYTNNHGDTVHYVSQSTRLTARQLRTFATDAMALAAEMLVEPELIEGTPVMHEPGCVRLMGSTRGPCTCGAES